VCLSNLSVHLLIVLLGFCWNYSPRCWIPLHL
jgi:hypothetical protein